MINTLKETRYQFNDLSEHDLTDGDRKIITGLYGPKVNFKHCHTNFNTFLIK